MTDRDTQSSEDDLLTIGEAAKLAHCSIATLRRWDDAGQLRSIRTPGNQRRFRRGDVLELLRPTDA